MHDALIRLGDSSIQQFIYKNSKLRLFSSDDDNYGWTFGIGPSNSLEMYQLQIQDFVIGLEIITSICPLVKIDKICQKKAPGLKYPLCEVHIREDEQIDKQYSLTKAG